MIQFAKNLKIGTKISLCIVLASALPLIIVANIFFRPLYDMVAASTVRQQQESLAQMAPLINSQAIEISDIADRILTHRYAEVLFDSKKGVDSTSVVSEKNCRDFSESIKTIIEETPVNEVKVYYEVEKGEAPVLPKTGSEIFVDASVVSATYWHGIFSGSNYSSLYCPDFYLSGKEKDTYGDNAFIIRKNMYVDGKTFPCFIALYYDSQIYSEILKQATTTKGSVSYIINNRDALVVTTDIALSGTYRVRYDSILRSLLASSSIVEREIAGANVYVLYSQIEVNDWFMVNVIPKTLIVELARSIMGRIQSIFAVCFLAALVIAIILSRSVTNRIAAVAKKLGDAHDGPPEPMEESNQNDEVGQLINTYNYMSNEMKELIAKQKETAEELRVAEFNALQAQINPHFLYNTMDMINWMALQGRNDEVSEVVQNLSKFYKLTLSRKKDYSTIADELEHAQVYIDLQNKRFNDGIEFVVDVPDELTAYRLPRLTLQPILENAILHGILEKESKEGTIVLTIWTDADDILILISDDGVGMDENTRSQILKEKRVTPTNSRGSNIAVVNIHRRLQLLYGERYGLLYESEPGRGCDVTIRIPKHLGDEDYVKNN